MQCFGIGKKVDEPVVFTSINLIFKLETKPCALVGTEDAVVNMPHRIPGVVLYTFYTIKHKLACSGQHCESKNRSVLGTETRCAGQRSCYSRDLHGRDVGEAS